MMTDSTTEEERRIAVAVDEGEESVYALQWFLRNQISDNANYTLILIYVKPQLPVYSMYGSGYLFANAEIESMDRYGKDLAGSVLERAENICRSYRNDQVKVETKACRGDAKDVICAMVENVGAELLVMGSHGYGFIKRALVGSVSDHCAQNAKCPVVIVKRPAH